MRKAKNSVNVRKPNFNQLYNAPAMAHSIISGSSPWTCEPVLWVWLIGQQENGPNNPLKFIIKDVRPRFISEFGGRFKESVVDKAFAGLCEKGILKCIRRGEYMFRVTYIYKGDTNEREERLKNESDDRSKELRGIPDKVDSQQREA